MHERVNRSFRIAATIVIAVALTLSASAGAAPGAFLPLDVQPQLAADAPATAPAAAQPAKQAKAPKAKKAAKTKSPAHVHSPDAGPWDTGALWITLRAGYNHATYRTAGDGNVGWGFGASRMIKSGWALGGMVERNTLGKFGNATESEIPFTLELDRHLKGSTFRPYFGFGGGTYYHKFANTTADHSEVRGGGFIAIGGNAVASSRNLIGVDARIAFVSALKGDTPDDPVFGPQENSTTRYSIKVTWSTTY